MYGLLLVNGGQTHAFQWLRLLIWLTKKYIIFNSFHSCVELRFVKNLKTLSIMQFSLLWCTVRWLLNFQYILYVKYLIFPSSNQMRILVQRYGRTIIGWNTDTITAEVFWVIGMHTTRWLLDRGQDIWFENCWNMKT